tara:strand:- start:784 stop:1200 length:417 start_codon:yes stop_codon:yes gene_type:complete
MGDKYRKTVKEETMDKLNMTSKEYDKIQQMYFSQDPEAYSDVANSIAKEDKRRMDLNKQMELKELDKKIKASGNQKIKKNNKGGLLKNPPNKGVTKLPKEVRNKMGFLRKGGKVKKIKKCKMDGIALRGKTRAKQRSK